jgi:aryl-alcohol dehydrogenase-like predicted oxidoreductase
VWSSRGSTSAIIGFSSINRLEQAIAARVKSLTDEEEKYLEETY